MTLNNILVSQRTLSEIRWTSSEGIEFVDRSLAGIFVISWFPLIDFNIYIYTLLW